LTLKTEQHGQVIIVHIKGVCNIDTSSELKAYLQALLAKGADTVALNCNGLDLMDSTAIGALMRFLRDARLNDKSLVLYDLTEYMTRIFQRTFWDNIFTVISKEDFEREYLEDCRDS
ncbi:MAG: STAS domain-containing protein, partial [bacterium]|nr:STAS domain-containing protein [bacterium]